jgi:hypothetical protein
VCTTEIRALRTLSRRTAHATRILHHGALELTHPSGDLLALLSDASEFGTLDRFTAMQVRYTVSISCTYTDSLVIRTIASCTRSSIRMLSLL